MKSYLSNRLERDNVEVHLIMSRKNVLGSFVPLSIEHAAALHLVAPHEPTFVAEKSFKRVLKAVKLLIKNKGLTYRHFKDRLTKWFSSGWILVQGKVLKITKAGLYHLQQLVSKVPPEIVSNLRTV